MYAKSGRERGIRTPGGVTLNGFQDRRFQPLSHLPPYFVKKDVEIGGDTQIRTGESRLCRPMPYHLAMSPPLLNVPQKNSKVVPETGLEPVQTQCPRDFKSLVSTNFTTRALFQKGNSNTLQISKTYCKKKLLCGF